MEEEWKWIDDFENMYQISSLGRVRSVDRYDSSGRFFESKMKAIHSLPTGYRFVQLYKHNKMKQCYVHRLLGFAFLEKRPEHTQINHIDGVKHNNELSNLEWCTESENKIHGWKTGLYTGNKRCRGEKHPSTVLKEKQVIEIWERYKSGEKTHEIAVSYGVSYMIVSLIGRGKTWEHLKLEPILRRNGNSGPKTHS